MSKLKQAQENHANTLKEIQELVSRSQDGWNEDDARRFDILEPLAEKEKAEIAGLARIERAQTLVSRSSNAPSQGKAYNAADSYKVSANDEELAFRAWGLAQAGKGWGKLSDPMKRAVDKVGLDLNANELEIAVRAQTVGTPAEGGYLTNSSIFTGLVQARKTWGGIRSVSSVVNVPTGETRNWATYDGTAKKAIIVAENTTLTNDSRTFGTLPIAIYKFATSIFPVSHEILQDANIPIESLFTASLYDEIGRAQNHYGTVGDGTGEPHGIQTTATSAVSAASSTLVDYDDLQDLMAAVDVAYHENAVFMMSQARLNQIHKLTDPQERPLFLYDYINQKAKTLFGFPVVINNYMENGTGKKAVLFGDFKGYQYVEALTVQIKAQDYPLDDYTAFVAKARSGSRQLDLGAVKAITMA